MPLRAVKGQTEKKSCQGKKKMVLRNQHFWNLAGKSLVKHNPVLVQA